MTDPRIDPLNSAAILTDTQMRLTFAPADFEQKEKVTALKVPVRAAKIAQLQSQMLLGTVHLQVKAGFAPERHIELSGPELMILIDLADRFVTELPRARQASAQPESSAPCSEDIFVWPDGDWCFRDDAEEMTHKSDDYEVVPMGVKRWFDLQQQ